MKTAVSIPNDLFRAADRLARRLKLSRSELYAIALKSFVSVKSADTVTETLNEVYAAEESRLDPTLSAIQYASLSGEKWE